MTDSYHTTDLDAPPKQRPELRRIIQCRLLHLTVVFLETLSVQHNNKPHVVFQFNTNELQEYTSADGLTEQIYSGCRLEMRRESPCNLKGEFTITLLKYLDSCERADVSFQFPVLDRSRTIVDWINILRGRTSLLSLMEPTWNEYEGYLTAGFRFASGLAEGGTSQPNGCRDLMSVPLPVPVA